MHAPTDRNMNISSLSLQVQHVSLCERVSCFRPQTSRLPRKAPVGEHAPVSSLHLLTTCGVPVNTRAQAVLHIPFVKKSQRYFHLATAWLRQPSDRP